MMSTSKKEEDQSSPLDPTKSAPLLTLSQATTLYCLFRGEKPREIAGRLGVTLETIRSHERRLYRKFGVHSREELISRATAWGYCQKGAIIVKRVEEDQ
jgi:DNA-binding CsgD family transcriptional regulator